MAKINKKAGKKQVSNGKLPCITTPVGEMIYPWLNKPDVRFDKGDGGGVYKVSIQCKLNDPQVREIVDVIDEHNEGSNVPYEVDEEAGTITFKAKAKADYPPALFDSKGKPIDRNKVKVYGGSRGRMKARLSQYDGFGGGINLYLNAVQIHTLATAQSSFDELEDGEYVEDTSRSFSDDTSSDSDAADADF